MPMLMITNSHETRMRPTKATTRSTKLLKSSAQEMSGVVRKTSIGRAPKASKVRARNGGANEVGDQPCFHSLDFAGGNRLLQPIHMTVAASKNDAAHGMLVQRMDEIIHGLRFDIDLRDDLDLHYLLRGKAVAQLKDILGHPRQDHAFPKVSRPLPVAGLGVALPEQEHDCRKYHEKRHDGAAGNGQPQEIGAGGHDQPQPKKSSGNLSDGFTRVLPEGILIEPLDFEQDRAERQNQEKQPLKIRERSDGLVAKNRPVSAEETEGMRHPEGNDHEDAVRDLEELEIEFLFSTEHGVCWTRKTSENMSAIKISSTLRGGMKVVGTVHSEGSLYLALRLYVGEIDYIELRVDHFAAAPQPLLEAASILPAACIVTVRHPDEGGANHLDEEQRRLLFRQLLPFAAYIDVELRSLMGLKEIIAEARELGAKVIVSDHHFDRTPPFRTLETRRRQAEKAGADIFKVATRTESSADLCVLLKLLETGGEIPLSAMGMGKYGKVSRLLLAQAGSAFNYGYLDQPNASGQWEASHLKKLLKEFTG